MQCPTCKGYRHTGECKTSDMDNYLAYKAEAERLQALYLSFVQQLPTVYERTREEQDEADALNWSMIQANRKVRAAEFELKWKDK